MLKDDEFSIKEQLGLPPGFGEEEKEFCDALSFEGTPLPCVCFVDENGNLMLSVTISE